MSFLDAEMLRENAKLVIKVYHKLTSFSGACTHLESFLPSTHKFGLLCSLDILLYAQSGQNFIKNI